MKFRAFFSNWLALTRTWFVGEIVQDASFAKNDLLLAWLLCAAPESE